MLPPMLILPPPLLLLEASVSCWCEGVWPFILPGSCALRSRFGGGGGVCVELCMLVESQDIPDRDDDKAGQHLPVGGVTTT